MGGAFETAGLNVVSQIHDFLLCKFVDDQV